MASVSEAIELLTLQYRTQGEDQAVAAAGRVAASTNAVTEAEQRKERATQSVARSYNVLIRKYDEVGLAERELAHATNLVTQARRQGIGTEAEYARIMDNATAALNRRTAALRQSDAAQRSASVGFGANDNFRRTNLGYQGFDIIGQGLMAGTPLAIIAAQQGPQIAQLYAAQGGLNALWKDATGLLGGLARAAGPWIAAAGAIYGAYRLIGSYSAEAALAVDKATAALAAQAAPIGSVRSGIGELASLQKTYKDAIENTANVQSAATALTISNTEREFNAKKSLLELELRRQDAAIKAQQAELAVEALRVRREIGQGVFTRSDLEAQGFADPKIGSVPFVRLPDDVTGLEKTRDILENSPITRRIEELRANLTLTELAAEQLREALKSTFNDSSLLPAETARDPLSGRLMTNLPIPTFRGVDDIPEVNKAGSTLIRAQQDRIEALRLEMELLGQTDQVRKRMLAQLEAEHRIREAGIDIGGREAQQYRAGALAISDYEASLEKAAKAQDEVNKRAEFFGDLTMGVIDDLTSGADGLEKALKRVVGALADAVLQAMLLGQGPLAGFFGTAPTGGNTVGGLVGQIFGNRGAGTGGGGAAIFGTIGGFADMLGGGSTSSGRVAANSNFGPPPFLGGIGSPGNVDMTSTGSLALQSYGSDLATNTRILADRLGASARDLAAVFSFESRFKPDIWGGAGGRHYGLIQAGPTERATYGITPGGSLASQFSGIERYFQDRGFKPGMSGMDLYSTVNAGRPGLYNRSDAANGGTWGSVADKWNHQFGPHFKRADDLLGKFNDTAAKATGGLGGVGSASAEAATGLTDASKGLSAFGNMLSQFPAAPGGGGGIGGLLGGLFGGGGLSSAFSGTAAFDWLSANPGGYIGLYHSGGIAGSPSMMRGGVDPRIFDGAPRYHGGGIAGDEVPAILKRGEPVFKSMEHARQMLGGTRITVNRTIINNAGVEVTERERQNDNGTVDIETVIDRTVADRLNTRGTASNRALRRAGGRAPLKTGL